MNVLSSKEGATILGASVVDDIVVVIILSVAVGMIGASTGGNTEVSFIVKLIEQGLFFIGIFFLVRFIAPYLLRLSQKNEHWVVCDYHVIDYLFGHGLFG